MDARFGPAVARGVTELVGPRVEPPADREGVREPPLGAPGVREHELVLAGRKARRHDRLEELRADIAHVLQLALADRADYDFARQVIARHRLGPPLHVLLSPLHGELSPPDLARWILEDRLAHVRLNLQLHRLLWPDGAEACCRP